jgi:hypothetical protein
MFAVGQKNMIQIRKAFAATSFFVTLLIFPGAILAAGDDWRPVTPAELEMKTPKVEPGADAEVIFWEVRVDDSKADLSRLNYVRVKIFTERGREMFSKYDIPYIKGTSVRDVEARVTKPDGSTLFLKPEDVFEREILRAEGVKVKAKSFAVPGLEVRSIIEFRYRESIDHGVNGMRLIFQRDIPVQTASYYLKPFRGRAAMYGLRFNMGDTGFENDKNGYKRITMNNLPALPNEPDMPPENEVRAWMYVYYSMVENVGEPAAYWKMVNKLLYDASKKWVKPEESVKKAAVEIIAGAATDDEKLRKIYEFTQRQIKNTRILQAGAPVEENKKGEVEKTPADTLQLKVGTPTEIDNLFGAMAAAAGFDVRAAYTGDRSELLFTPDVADAVLMLSVSVVSVRVGDTWRFFSPASFDMPYGMLNWLSEDETALVTGPSEPTWLKIPLSPAEKSAVKRTGNFKLLADGTLEGEAKIEFTGNPAASNKALNRGDSAGEQETNLKAYVKNAGVSGVEVENPRIEGLNEPGSPFIYKFKLRIPNYAAKTGKRLFFQPNIFARNSTPRFTSNNRKSEIYFRYPWLEFSEFTIELPAGFILEDSDGPQSILDRAGIGRHETQITVSKDGRFLTYKREFSFGHGGATRFGTEMYPVLKGQFDAYQTADTFQLALKGTVLPSRP